MFLNPDFKMVACFANVARTTVSKRKFILQEIVVKAVLFWKWITKVYLKYCAKFCR